MGQIINPPQIPLLQVGNYIFTDTRNLIVLTGFVNGAGSGNCTLRAQGASAGYQVTSGKTFQVYAMRVSVAMAGAGIFILQSDNDVGLATGTVFTNIVYPGGNLNAATVMTGLSTSTTGSEAYFRFNIAAGKYVSVTNNAGSLACAVQLFGYEV